MSKLSRHWYVAEIDQTPGNVTAPPIRIHSIELSEWAYTQICSFNAFFNQSYRKSFHRNWTNSRLYMSMTTDEYQWRMSKFPWYNDIPVVTHTSIWDFYKAIGYEHKKNKYTDPTIKLRRTPRHGH